MDNYSDNYFKGLLKEYLSLPRRQAKQFLPPKEPPNILSNEYLEYHALEASM